jgi:hypothetical protein
MGCLSSSRKCRSSRYGAGWFATWRGSVFSVGAPKGCAVSDSIRLRAIRLFGWHRFAGVRFRGLGCGEFFRSQSGSVHTGMCHHFLVCNDVLQHLHPLRPKTAKIESRPQARHWRSHKTVAEVDRCSAIVENHS